MPANEGLPSDRSVPIVFLTTWTGSVREILDSLRPCPEACMVNVHPCKNSVSPSDGLILNDDNNNIGDRMII